MISLMKTAVFLIFFVNIVSGFQTIINDENINEGLTSSLQMQEHEYSVEVSIVCDRDFGTIFQYNKTKILEYWKALFLDVHMRFKTLQSVNISFSVLKIVILETAKEQPFIERARYNNGTVLLQDAITNFQEWLYTDDESPFRSYDITILALGTDSANRTTGLASVGGGCIIDPIQRRVWNGLVVTIRGRDVAGTLAHEIAHTLGAPHENEESYSIFECGVYNNTEHYFLMEAEIDEDSYFFSHCTDKIIAAFLELDHKNCLKQKNSTLHPLFSTSMLVNVAAESFLAGGISIQEQCQLLRNNSMGYVLPEEALCSLSKCRLNVISGESLNDEISFVPFDGSPCDEHKNGHCFRGMCLPRGFQLMNVDSGECLGAANSSLASDKPTLKKCSTSALSTFDLIRILTKSENQTVFFMVYSTLNGNDTFGKCLGLMKNDVDGFNSVLRFERCDANTLFEWKMIPVRDGEFLLRHKITQQCLTVLSNKLEVGSESDCKEANSGMVWKFLNENGTDVRFNPTSSSDISLRLYIVLIFVCLIVACITKTMTAYVKVNNAAMVLNSFY